jgi:hypothetical protein
MTLMLALLVVPGLFHVIPCTHCLCIVHVFGVVEIPQSLGSPGNTVMFILRLPQATYFSTSGVSDHVLASAAFVAPIMARGAWPRWLIGVYALTID